MYVHVIISVVRWVNESQLSHSHEAQAQAAADTRSASAGCRARIAQIYVAMGYPLVNVYITMENHHVDLPIDSMVIFHSYGL